MGSFGLRRGLNGKRVSVPSPAFSNFVFFQILSPATPGCKQSFLANRCKKKASWQCCFFCSPKELVANLSQLFLLLVRRKPGQRGQVLFAWPWPQGVSPSEASFGSQTFLSDFSSSETKRESLRSEMTFLSF